MWLRVNSKALLQEIQTITKITYTTTAVSYCATYDAEEEMLIVDLKQK